MLVLGLLIGIYSYSILTLGLFRLLFFQIIFPLTFLCLIAGFILLRKFSYSKAEIVLCLKDKKSLLIITLILFFILVNFIGALGPETAFDATWYHLTIPKIFKEENMIFFIKSNLFYYSLMPKLTEMLYLASLIISNEIFAKLIHFTFGLLTTIVTYKIARIYLNRHYSLLAVLIFYSNLVIAWLSITSYVELSRAFFESLALLCFLLHLSKGKFYLHLSAVFLGLAMSTKLIAFLSVPIFIFLIFYAESFKLKEGFIKSCTFVILAITVACPWYLMSYLATGNPIYPFLTPLYIDNSYQPLTFTYAFISFKKFFIESADPVSPIYLLFFPFVILNFASLLRKAKFLFLYSLASLLILAITPISGGGRFIVQFLPAYSVVIVFIISTLKNPFQKKILLVSVAFVFFINISYRAVANLRFAPYALGFQTKEDYLMKNLNFDFGDFYDQGGKIKSIVKNDKVLLLNMHNLYYVDFTFTLDDWDDKNYKYVLTQGIGLPERFKNSKLVYQNKITKAKLYKLL